MFRKARVGLYLRFSRPSLRKEPVPFTDILRSARHILVRPPSGPGELLFSLKALGSIRRIYPGCELSLLVPERRIELVNAAGLADRVISYAEPLVPFTGAFKNMRKSLRRADFDLYLDFNRPQDENRRLFGSMGAAKIRMGMSTGEDFPYLNYEIKVAPEARDEVSRSLALLSWIDRSVLEEDGTENYRISMDDKLWVDEFLISHSSISTEKRVMVDLSLPRKKRGWELESLLNVFRGLEQLCSPRFFIVPSPEAELTSASLSLGVQRQVVVVDEPIVRTASLMQRCDLIISSRSDLFSLAHLFELPSIILLPEHEEFYPPTSARLRVFRVKRGAPIPSAEIVGAAAVLMEKKTDVQ
jgi:ADP-heptose:LPS heptosyltransferase